MTVKYKESQIREFVQKWKDDKGTSFDVFINDYPVPFKQAWYDATNSVPDYNMDYDLLWRCVEDEMVKILHTNRTKLGQALK